MLEPKIYFNSIFHNLGGGDDSTFVLVYKIDDLSLLKINIL